MPEAIEIRGLSEALEALRKLPRTLQGRALRRAMAAGARVVRADAKAEARGSFHSRTGAIVRNITVRRGKKPSPYPVRYLVGVQHGKPRTQPTIVNRGGKTRTIRLSAYDRRGEDPFYFRFLELGTRWIRRRDFLAHGLQIAAQKAVEAVRNRLWDEIRKIVASRARP